MAGYSTSAPPQLIVAGSIDNALGFQIWGYDSPTDSAATVCGAGYFTNALLLGMRVGDWVIINDRTNTIIKGAQVMSFSGNAASLNATPTTIGAAT